MNSSSWKTAFFTLGTIALAAVLILGGAKAADFVSFGRHHHDYHSAAFRLADAAHHLR